MMTCKSESDAACKPRVGGGEHKNFSLATNLVRGALLQSTLC